MKEMKRGFTLIELIISISIIAILIVASMIYYTGNSARTRDARRRIDMQNIRSALELYRSNNNQGAYPISLTSAAGFIPGYMATVPLDPNRLPYTYTPSPGGCNNTTVYCLSYTLSITMESPVSIYSVQPNTFN